jgi:hypothetical protein
MQNFTQKQILEITKKDIKSIIRKQPMQERSMPICFTTDQYKKIEAIAKQKGMLNSSQLIEEALNEV